MGMIRAYPLFKDDVPHLSIIIWVCSGSLPEERSFTVCFSCGLFQSLRTALRQGGEPFYLEGFHILYDFI